MHERDVLLAALEKTRPEEREAYLSEVCGADAQLRSRLEALLRASEVQDSFLEHPAIETQVLGSETHPSRPNHADEELSLDFLHPADDAEALGRLGPYTITEVIGRGGMGLVLKARDPKLNRIVALKVLAPELATNPTARKRFQREAHAAAAVVHQHIVTIHAVDEDRLPYLVMECIVGQSLKEKIDREGHLQLVEILRIGQQVASGLAAAHAHGLIHRDVKPANILLENGIERVRITDFGLARAVDDVGVTRTGEVAGTPQYMSPEQAQGLPMDARSDLFSFGCVLYAMCTGRPPFRAETAFATARRVCEDTPRPIRDINPEIPQWLTDIIERLLQKDPAQRFQSTKEVAELLGQYLAHAQQPGIVPLPGREPVSVQRNPGLPPQWAGALIALLLVLALALGLSEAAGTTKVVPTVIRIVRGEGTLVIEVDDPTVQVSLDGKELSIRGAGLQEFRLLPGKHRLHATKDGEPIKDEVVTITRDGQKVVTVTRGGLGGSGSSGLAPSAERTAVEELKLLAKLEGHTDVVRAVAFLPDGRRLVSVSNNSLPDGRQMVSVSYDTLERISDLPTRTVLSTLSADCYLVKADVSADGRLIAVLLRDGSKAVAQVWDIEKPVMMCEFNPERSSGDNCIRFTPDGTRLVTSGQRLRYATLWDAATGMELGRFDTGDTNSVHHARFSPDGRLLAIGAVGHVRLFDVESRNALGDVGIRALSVSDLAFAASGKVLATAQTGGLVSLIDVASRRVIKTLQDSDRLVRTLTFLDDDLFLLTSYDATLRLWDLQRERVVARAKTENGTAQGLYVLPNGREVITAGGKEWDNASQSLKDHGDYDLRLWQLPESVWPKQQTGASPTKEPSTVNGKAGSTVEQAFGELTLLTKLQGHTNIVHALSFLPDGERMVSVDQSTVVRTWDLETCSALSTLDLKGRYCSAAEVSDDGRFVAIATASAQRTKAIRVWDLQTRKQICEAVQQDVDWLTFIRFTPDGTRIVTSGKPSAGVLWDVATGEEVQRFEVEEPQTFAVSFSPNGRLLAMGTVGRVRLFDVERGGVLGDVHLPEPHAVISLAFAPGGDSLACGQTYGHTCVIDVNSRQLTASLTNDQSRSHVVSMRFLDNERLLLTRLLGELEVWDVIQKKILATAASEQSGTTKRLAVSPGRHYVLTGHGEGWDDKSNSRTLNGDYALRLWQLPESVWLKQETGASSTENRPTVNREPGTSRVKDQELKNKPTQGAAD